MKWPKRQQEPQTAPAETPDDVIAAAKAAFEAAAPGIGLCDDCAHPIGSREHRKRCGA